MKEADVRAEVFNLMRRLWLWPVTQTDLRPVLTPEARKLMGSLEQSILLGSRAMRPQWYAFKKAILASTQQPPSGRPDILCLSPGSKGRSIVVEVKTFPEPRMSGGWEQASCTFPFSAIPDNQRRWLSNYQDDADHSPGWYPYEVAYLALGMRHGTAGAKKTPRQLWLVPWPQWLQVEDKLRVCQESLPLSVIKGLRKEIQEDDLTAYGLLKRWSLEWENGCWHLPAYHPLKIFIGGAGERDLEEEKIRWRS